MTFSKHYIGVLIRITLLVAASGGVFYFGIVQGLYMTGILLSFLVVIQGAELFRLIRKTNREITRLFESVQNNDFSLHFSERNEGNGFDELHASLNNMIEAYKKVKVQKEQHYHQLAQIVEYLNSGIISFDNTGQIQLINSAATRLLAIPSFKNLTLLEAKRPEWFQKMVDLPYNEQRALDFSNPEVASPQLIFKGKIKLGDQEQTIVSFQNIQDEAERQEVLAYHKLIRILTHEIMNSVTPIASLTDTLNQLLLNPEGKPILLSELSNENLEDLSYGLNTIHRRSEGLLRFVTDYRKLTRIPNPNPEKIDLELWWKSVLPLVQEMTESAHIALRADVNTRRKSAFFDTQLIEQVLINLLKNGIEACAPTAEPKIKISLNTLADQWSLSIENNGTSIPADKAAQIFIPFYSTKAEGSGIGLPLSKSIAQAHRGNLHWQNTADGVEFALSLPLQPKF